MKRPALDQALGKLAGQLLTRHAPAAADEYRAVETHLISVCLLMASEQAGRGPLDVLAEAAALREVFARRAPLPTDRDLAERMKRAAGPEPTPRTDAEARHQLDALRTVLIEYHAWVESQLGEDSEENREIWALLAAHHRPQGQ